MTPTLSRRLVVIFSSYIIDTIDLTATQLNHTRNFLFSILIRLLKHLTSCWRYFLIVAICNAENASWHHYLDNLFNVIIQIYCAGIHKLAIFGRFVG